MADGVLLDAMIPAPAVFYKIFLCIERFCAFLGRGALIGPVTLQHSQFAGIAQLNGNYFREYRMPDLCIPDREEHFNALVKVPGHEIRAAQVHLLVAAIAEIINPGMLQKPANNGGHFDILTDTGNSRAEAADAAYLQLNVQTGL
jgi:hypothetical protein